MLCGHVRGAFTGAVNDTPGLIESAAGGTLFLDDVTSLPLDVQPVLLRVLQSRVYHRLGEGKERTADFRLIASAKEDLEVAKQEGRFRVDLSFRLAAITIELPPLRERLDDIALLARHFAEALGAEPPRLLLPTLSARRWPGNVRELKNEVERAITLGALYSPQPAGDDEPENFHRARDKSVSAFERTYLEELLRRHHGVAAAVAREAGIARSYLYRLLAAHGLSPDDFRK